MIEKLLIEFLTLHEAFIELEKLFINLISSSQGFEMFSMKSTSIETYLSGEALWACGERDERWRNDWSDIEAYHFCVLLQKLDDFGKIPRNLLNDENE